MRTGLRGTEEKRENPSAGYKFLFGLSWAICDTHARIAFSSAVYIEAVFRIRCAVIRLFMEYAYAVLPFNFDPSVKHRV